MGRIVTEDFQESKLRRHNKAIRENKLSVAHMILFLEEDPPNASAAKECLDELGYEGIDIWSCSTTAGGIWERWERDALKYGELTDAYRIWCARNNR